MDLFDRLVNPDDPDLQFTSVRDGKLNDHTWADVLRTGHSYAAGLRDAGVEPGARVGAVLTNSFECAAFVLGTWWSGATLVSFPTPARGTTPEDYLAGLLALCTHAEVEIICLDGQFAEAIRPHAGLPVFAYDALATDRTCPQHFASPDATVFIQYSSGSTSAPKGCELSAAAIAEQLEMLSDRLLPVPGVDRTYSWLPMSHDMGLFGGFLFPWATGQSLCQSSPERFLRAPYTWLEECRDREITYTVGPGFGLGMVLRAQRRSPLTGTLKLRSWIVGSDPIDYGLVRQVTDSLSGNGLGPNVIRPAYGMAEATLAVSMTELAEAPTARAVDLNALYSGALTDPVPGQPAAQIVSCGPPVRGTEIWVDGPENVGELMLSSPSLARGYLNDPARTASSFPEHGILRTGDVGFIADGEVYVIGRNDDMLSVGGRNVYTSIIEGRIGADDRIRPGSCALVDVHGTDGRSLIVVAEPASPDIDFAQTAQEIRRLAAGEAGVGVDECVFVPRGRLPKSPSGKVQRFKCRTLLSSDTDDFVRITVG